jgi:hypothetical protein
MTDAGPGTRAHYVVVGDSPLAYRLTRALSTRFGGTVAVLVPDRTSRYAQEMDAFDGVELIETNRVDEESLAMAGAGRAAAAALVDQDDGGNVALALLLREAARCGPDLRRVPRPAPGARPLHGPVVVGVRGTRDRRRRAAAPHPPPGAAPSPRRCVGRGDVPADPPGPVRHRPGRRGPRTAQQGGAGPPHPEGPPGGRRRGRRPARGQGRPRARRGRGGPAPPAPGGRVPEHPGGHVRVEPAR